MLFPLPGKCHFLKELSLSSPASPEPGSHLDTPSLGQDAPSHCSDLTSLWFCASRVCTPCPLG